MSLDATRIARSGLPLILGFVVSMAACGSTTTAAPPESVVVSVTPSSASVPVSQTMQFNASLQNDNQNKGVTWTMTQSGISCSTACGVLSTSGTSAIYHAPSTVPKGSSVVLTATSLANSADLASAQITVTTQASPAISVSLVPISASIAPSQTQPFTAAIMNDSQNEGVTWTLTQSGVTCAPACGSIIGFTPQSAIYLAPATIPNPPSATITATSVADGTQSASGTITVGAASPVNNVRQWFAVTNFGARAVTNQLTTMATCTSGSNILTLAADPGLQNGDGLTVWGCGPTAGLSQPGPPTVSTGDSVTETVPNAVLAPVGGFSSYNYKIIAVDNAGGFSPVSAATTIATAPATLGENSCTVSSESLSGSTLTVVTSAPCGLVPRALVHIHGSSLAALDQWVQVSSATNPTTFVFNGLSLSGTMTSKGGTLVYWAGNQLTWTGQSGTWLYGICAQRPSDSSFHLIGISLPNVASLPSSTTFTDWGTTLTTFPTMPAYWNDSLCTNSLATPDYLSTIISGGAGTILLSLADAASNSTSDARAMFDDGPGFRAAAKFAAPYHAAVFIPPPIDPTAVYPINSYTNMIANGPAVIQSGPVVASETIQAPTQWTGPWSPGSQLQFQQKATPTIYCSVSPCFYINNGLATYIDGLALGSGGNQAYVVVWDGLVQGSQLNNLNISTGGGGTDYSGMSLIVRNGPYFFQMQNLTMLGGPSAIAANVDQSWTPQEYFLGDPDAAVENLSQDYVSFNSRTAYLLMKGGNATGEFRMLDVYAQGGLMPALATQNVNDTTLPPLILNNFTQDTSPQPLVATWQDLPNGANAPQIAYTGPTIVGADTGGFPPIITGNAPGSISLPSSYTLPTGGGQYVNVSAQPMSVSAGTQTNTTEFAIGLAQPVISSVTISPGGTFPVESGNLCVSAVGWNGGWSVPACTGFQTSPGNQTITVTMAGRVQGAKGYIIYTGGGQCFTPGNGCVGQISTAGTSYTQSTDPGCCSQIPTNNYPTDGSSWISTTGVGGPQLTTYNGPYDDNIVPGALTGDQSLIEPNASGTIALAGSSGISAGSILISGTTVGIYTFVSAYPSTPNCVVSPSGTFPTPLTYEVSSSPSAVTVTLASSGTAKFNFVCYPPTN
jgi:hypothetical protein